MRAWPVTLLMMLLCGCTSHLGWRTDVVARSLGDGKWVGHVTVLKGNAGTTEILTQSSLICRGGEPASMLIGDESPRGDMISMIVNTAADPRTNVKSFVVEIREQGEIRSRSSLTVNPQAVSDSRSSTAAVQ